MSPETRVSGCVASRSALLTVELFTQYSLPASGRIANSLGFNRPVIKPLGSEPLRFACPMNTHEEIQDSLPTARSKTSAATPPRFSTDVLKDDPELAEAYE